jgi:predicted nucleic-acid-binding protein
MATKNMRPQVLDTNVLVRFLVGDNAAQQKQAEQWFASASKGRRKLHLLPMVVAESIFVIESVYKKGRKEIAEALEVFVSQHWLNVTDRGVVLRALKLYTQRLHFVDCYLLAWAAVNKSTVLTFDKQMKKSKLSGL